MKKILIIISIFIFLLALTSSKNQYVIIPEDSIRFRIIPSSNNIEDQNMKEKVKNNLEKEIVNLSSGNNINESRKTITNNLDNFKSNIDKTFKDNNYNKDFKVNYGLNYFPEKTYKGVKYKKGYYESLVVEIGKAEGDNFWCVLFPPLCLLEAEKTNKSEIEYKSYIKELIDKYFN
ncbi:MAG: stage II sporulation protein R [Bacilli bacterium]